MSKRRTAMRMAQVTALAILAVLWLSAAGHVVASQETDPLGERGMSAALTAEDLGSEWQLLNEDSGRTQNLLGYYSASYERDPLTALGDGGPFFAASGAFAADEA